MIIESIENVPDDEGRFLGCGAWKAYVGRSLPGEITTLRCFPHIRLMFCWMAVNIH
jgi:hypothetical protein